MSAYGDPLVSADENEDARLRSLLVGKQFSRSIQPAKQPPLLRFLGHTILSAQNASNIQGQAKSAKSAVVGGIIAAIFNASHESDDDRDTLGFTAEPAKGMVLHIDTEQAPADHWQSVENMLKRAGYHGEPPAWFESWTLREFSSKERRRMLDLLVQDGREKHGSVHLVIVDGAADITPSGVNDELASESLVDDLCKLASREHCGVLTIVHENPGAMSAKVRGHLGSFMERKFESMVRVEKDAKNISTAFCLLGRHCFVPKDKGHCFTWDNSYGMHRSIGAAGDIKKASKDAKLKEQAKTYLSVPKPNSEIVKDIMGKEEVTIKTAQNWIKSWVNAEIVSKESGIYALV